MKKVLTTLAMIISTLTVFVVSAMANPYAPPQQYDYSDATGYASTSVAYHSSASWQRLGTGWTSESSVYNNNGDADDGVSWSINGGAYGHQAITAGDTVTFQFTVYKELWGQHNTDYLRVWMDWNNDGDFNDANETIYTDSWKFTPQKDNTPESIAHATKYFTYTMVFDDVTEGDYWLRARVTCNDSINYNLNNFTSTGYLWQGEVEDWLVTVNDKTQVPEPASMLLLGLGLLALARVRGKIKA